ncbi:MAG: hypothetical protein SWJ54_17820, partial [Cyanobacteriota bacterium]|nr:hypothetical protein [Cyanobacteriota bacterium]
AQHQVDALNLEATVYDEVMATAADSQVPRVRDVLGMFQFSDDTIIRLGLNPIIFLINNDGYTVERMIHDGSYNDIQPWKYHQMPQVFGESLSFEVKTEGELEQALNKASEKSDRLCFIEVHLDRFDCCKTLARLTQAIRS